MALLHCKNRTASKFWKQTQEHWTVMYACACLASYCGTLPEDDCARMYLLTHLCVTLGKKARLHLILSLTEAETLPSLLDVCLKKPWSLMATPQKVVVLLLRRHVLCETNFNRLPFFFSNLFKSKADYLPEIPPLIFTEGVVTVRKGGVLQYNLPACHPPEIPVSRGWKKWFSL